MKNNTALSAEKAITFISDAHEKFYYEKLKEVRYPKGKVASAYDSLTKEVITSARQGDSHFAPQSKEVSADGQ